MNWVIVIFMFAPLHVEADAVEIDNYRGKPLVFLDKNSCYEHISENLDKLKAFAVTYFEGQYPVKRIDCFKQKESV